MLSRVSGSKESSYQTFGSQLAEQLYFGHYSDPRRPQRYHSWGNRSQRSPKYDESSHQTASFLLGSLGQWGCRYQSVISYHARNLLMCHGTILEKCAESKLKWLIVLGHSVIELFYLHDFAAKEGE